MTAVVTCSIEIELGWGVHDIGEYPHLSERGRKERVWLDRLLDRCDDVDVPISFDVVGHLCRAACDGDHDGPHEPGWFGADPGNDVTNNPLFYAPDAIDSIKQRPTDHELCTHTFSHALCDRVSRETLDWELAESQTELKRLTGSETVSIVPPRHYRPPADALRDAGIETMRICRDTSERSRPSRARELLLGPHPVFEPEIVDGIVETYCTSYPSLTSTALQSGQRPAAAPFRATPVRARQALHRRYLRRGVEEAIETEGYCHLWCHLYDLSNRYQFAPISDFLGELSALCDRGEIEVMTMAELNDHVRDREETVTARV